MLLKTAVLILAVSISSVVSSRAHAQPMPVQEVGLLPGDLTVTPATHSQQDHAIAKGGNQYLAVWMDTRGQSVGGGANQSGMDIFAIRLDLAGNPIDTAPFPVCVAAGWQQTPKVTWNGQQWLVTFYSQDPTEYYYQNNVRGVRVTPDGQVVDTTPLTLIENQQWWWIGGQEGQWLLTWTLYHEDGYGTYLAGRRLGNDGQFLDPAPIMLMDWTYLSSGNNVLAANGEYLVVGQDRIGIRTTTRPGASA